jgi:uncharacterized membrane protein (UPF0182 family)
VALVENRSRRQRAALIVLVAVVAAWFAARAVAGLVLDRWWYDSVTTSDVWRERFLAQLELFVGVGSITALVIGGSVWLILRLGRIQRAPTAGFIERYHVRMGPAHRWVLVGIAVYLVVHIGLAATQYWQQWLLFRFGGSVGASAPVSGEDIGYHLFRLPFLSAASDYLRQLFLFALVLAAIGHVMSGALRLPRGQVGSSRVAVGHLAMLGAGFLAVQALHDRFVAVPSIGTNRVGAFDGPGWTELHITKPGMVIAALVTLAAAFAAVWLARTGAWRPLAITLVVAAVVQLAVVVVLPMASERWVVAPAEAQRQLWSIEDNLEATRRAYALGDIGTQTMEPASNPELSAESVVDLARVPLFGAESMTSALQIVLGTTGTRISDVDLDRYVVDGATVPLYVAARSASRADLPERGWVQEHLVYTHGDGMVTVPANRTDTDGRPDVSAYPDAFGTAHLPLYFGESLAGWYAVVGTEREQLGGAEFTGEGVSLSSFGSRLVLALATGEPEPVFSNELTSDSLLLYRRSIRERIRALAPFLRLDSDAYPVITDGAVTWVVDGYTTSSTYPASQFTSGAGLPAQSGLSGRSINYLRASVKATVDAETGETHLYRTDGGDDPILDAWSGIFDGLLEPEESLPDDLVAHLRYPTDQWTVQTNLLGRYHVDTAEELFNGTQRWAVSAAASDSVGPAAESGPSPAVDEFSVLGEAPDRFARVRPYGPGSASNPTSSRNELSALAVADHTLPTAARLVEPGPSTSPLLSPQVAQSAIDADPTLARAITLLNANGSQVRFGPLTPMVTEIGLVWIRPLIVIGTSEASVPRLYGVAAVLEGQVAIEDSTVGAVEAVAATGRPGAQAASE